MKKVACKFFDKGMHGLFDYVNRQVNKTRFGWFIDQHCQTGKFYESPGMAAVVNAFWLQVYIHGPLHYSTTHC